MTRKRSNVVTGFLPQTRGIVIANDRHDETYLQLDQIFHTDFQ
jgi:hypothetical protein